MGGVRRRTRSSGIQGDWFRRPVAPNPYANPGGISAPACGILAGCIRLRGRGRPARLQGGEVPWRHGERWIPTGRHSPRPTRRHFLLYGLRFERRSPLTENKSIIAEMQRSAGGPGTRGGVGEGANHTASLAPQRPKEPRRSSVLPMVHVLSCRCTPEEVLDRGTCRWSACCASGAIETITADPKRWSTAGMPVVRVLSYCGRRHNHLDREMRAGT